MQYVLDEIQTNYQIWANPGNKSGEYRISNVDVEEPCQISLICVHFDTLRCLQQDYSPNLNVDLFPNSLSSLSSGTIVKGLSNQVPEIRCACA